MKGICKFIGIATIVMGVLGGIGLWIGHSFLAFILCITGSVIAAALYIAAAEILGNQEELLNNIQSLSQSLREEHETQAIRSGTVGSDEWQCKFCGRINKNYVGTCVCGHTKEETKGCQNA